MKKVGIILLNYNGSNDTLECIESLSNIDYKNYEIIVVDNASSIEDIAKLEKVDSQIKLIKSKENLGFAGGNNLGIKYACEAGCDYVLLLNNDTIVEADFLNILVSEIENNDQVGMVGPKIMYFDKKKYIWAAGGKIDFNKFSAFNLGEKEIDNGQYDELKQVDFISGCAMLIKKEVLDKVGGLPEEYFMYYEDVDYSLMVKKLGYKIIYTPTSKIYHKVSISTGGEESPNRIYFSNRARKIFMMKYKKEVSSAKFIAAYLYFNITRVIKLIKYIFKFEHKKSKAMIKALNYK